MKLTYKDMSIATANAIRASLLNANTTEAIHYMLLYDKDTEYTPEEISQVVSMVPVTGHGVLLLDKSSEVTSDDLTPLKPATIKDEDKLLSEIKIDKYKCLLWFNEDGELIFEDLIGNLRDKYDMREYLEEEPLTAVVIYKNKGESPKIRKTNIKVEEEISILPLEEGDHLRAVFVTEEGDPSEDPKYSAVTTASCYNDEDRTVSIEFETVTGQDHQKVFKKAIQSLIQNLSQL